MKIGILALKKLFLCALFLFLPLCLFAQAESATTVALFPVWGDNQDINRQFGEEVLRAVNNMSGYTPFTVDLRNRPDDVFSHGSPPYLSPSSSVTGTSTYAITGEVNRNQQAGQWHFRLYLWRMSDAKLICSDDLSALDRMECRRMLPALLEWMFSQIYAEQPVITAPQVPAVKTPVTPEQPLREPRPIQQTVADNWLNVGFRFGGGFQINSDPTWEVEVGFTPHDIYNYYQIIQGGLYLNIQPASFFGLQLEAIFAHNLEMERASLMFPALLRISHRKNTSLFSIMGGGFLTLPIGESADTYNFQHAPPFGWTAGILVGNKAGPGYYYLDLRFASDFGDNRRIGVQDAGFRRNMVSISVGYEFGFIER